MIFSKCSFMDWELDDENKPALSEKLWFEN